MAGIHRTGSDLGRPYPPKRTQRRRRLGKRGRGMLRNNQDAGGMLGGKGPVEDDGGLDLDRASKVQTRANTGPHASFDSTRRHKSGYRSWPPALAVSILPSHHTLSLSLPLSSSPSSSFILVALFSYVPTLSLLPRLQSLLYILPRS